ncbi:sensor histidine kinase [Deinococcus lacus]|uniref:histidine kinase n=1 Tax=Deinococcus lacus TaxID=392561 RepID=A0ABW1YDW6_9DEIO
MPLSVRPGTYLWGRTLVTVSVLSSIYGGQPVLLTVATEARSLSEAQQAFRRALWWWLPAALLLSLVLGWTVAGRLLRPVSELERAARAAGEGADLRRPLPYAGTPGELGRLSSTLQTTFAQLADARERERDFARAAAHDLRSPLAALTARVQGSLARPRSPERYRQDLEEIGHDLSRLSDLTAHLLTLSRDPAALERASVDLGELAANAVDRARELGGPADIDLVQQASVTVMGDRVLLGQAIWNLVVNALHHGHSPITVEAGPLEDGWAAVTVHDCGPGVPPVPWRAWAKPSTAPAWNALPRQRGARTGAGAGPPGRAGFRRAAGTQQFRRLYGFSDFAAGRRTPDNPDAGPPSARPQMH